MEKELLHGALKPGPDCVPIDELGRYADGALAPQERASVAAHVEACANCQAELALLRAFTGATVRDGERNASGGVAKTDRSDQDAGLTSEGKRGGRRANRRMGRRALQPHMTVMENSCP